MAAVRLGLSTLAPIYILPTNLPSDELHEIETAVSDAEGQLTYDAQEARIFVGNLSQKKRATFELRSRKVLTVDSPLPTDSSQKRRKLNSSTYAPFNEGSSKATPSGKNQDSVISEDLLRIELLRDHVVILKLAWLKNSLDNGYVLPLTPYLVYSGRITTEAQAEKDNPKPIIYIKAENLPSSPSAPQSSPNVKANEAHLTTILNQTEPESGAQSLPLIQYSPRRFRDQKRGQRLILAPSHPALKRTTTSEHDFLASIDKSQQLAPPPAWMLEPHPRANYACMRSTFAKPPNEAFLAHLYAIKEARLLTLDEIGVRAYSTSIAALAAYPHKIAYPGEITRLPGCSDKIAALWVEWYTSAEPDAPDSTRRLQVTDELAKNEDLKHLKIFYDIWGVGADTARKFYYDHGWKDIDDVVEFGWHTGILNRVQQIGVKFYDEFKVKIPRSEVEQIADTILRHARLCKAVPQECWSNESNSHRGNWSKPDDGHGDPVWDPRDMVCVIVGGYRRGKAECGDVDVILSHRDEDLTKDLVVDVVKSLEDEGWITHTLSLHTTSSDRDQQTLPHRVVGHAGHGFDTLDKALCVWQDPSFDAEKHDRNPNVHRRVDIIVSPWRTVGAAVLGWSGATTFERDIRRWCRKEKGWKFDSSGVRDRADGMVLDFETVRVPRNGKLREGEVADDGDGWEDRERRLMEGLQIGWRPAVARCTG